MCRSIRTLFNFDPPVTEGEIHAAALQFVRKVSGFHKPSQANEAAFTRAVADVVAASEQFLAALRTDAPPKNREEEALRARLRATQRFAR
ncbi:MAG: DUF2277 domain-containing protein [Betaproteobacteria bacterium]